MRTRRRFPLAIPALALVLATIAQGQSRRLIREDDVVRVESIAEHWLLVWREAPQPVCAPEDPNWFTCPCQGFAFGEMGGLDLVRRRPRHPDEIFPLTRVFSYGEVPSSQHEANLAAIQRWPVLNTDDEDNHSADFAKQVRQRPTVRAIRVADYDHDGRATEFPLLIASGPCGHNGVVVVGISRRQPSLHAFTSIVHPESPLILDEHIWDEFLHSHGQITTTEVRCGDHGGDEETEVHLTRSVRGIEAVRLTYDCKPDDSRGALKRTEAF